MRRTTRNLTAQPTIQSLVSMLCNMTRLAYFMQWVQSTSSTVTVIPVHWTTSETRTVFTTPSADKHSLPITGLVALAGERRLFVGHLEEIVEFQEDGLIVEVRGEAYAGGPQHKVWVHINYDRFTFSARLRLYLWVYTKRIPGGINSQSIPLPSGSPIFLQKHAC